MAEPQSDALVLFGITGDLAKKKLLPAVYHLAQRDRLPSTVIGVASRELPEGQLEAATARGSVRRRAGNR